MPVMVLFMGSALDSQQQKKEKTPLKESFLN